MCETCHQITQRTLRSTILESSNRRNISYDRSLKSFGITTLHVGKSQHLITRQNISQSFLRLFGSFVQFTHLPNSKTRNFKFSYCCSTTKFTPAVLTASTARLCLDWPEADSNRHWTTRITAPAWPQAGQRPTLPVKPQVCLRQNGRALHAHPGSGAALRDQTPPTKKAPAFARAFDLLERNRSQSPVDTSMVLPSSRVT